MSEPSVGEGDEAPTSLSILNSGELRSHDSAGSMLRAAREAQGMDLATLAALLKVAPRKLEELEADAHAGLQGPAFVRALSQAACRALRIDPSPVLARLPALDQHALEQVSGGLNAPFRERGMRRDSGSDQPWAARGFSALVLILVVGAAFLFLMPADFSWRSHLPGADSSVSPAESAASESADPALLQPMPIPALPKLSESASAAVPSSLPQLAPAPALAPASSALSSAAGSPVVVPVGLTALRVVTRADSWVEVVDGSGRTLVARTLSAGEDLSLDGAFPMRVKVGNVAATELRVRGQVWDLAAVSRDNVARTELK